MMDFFCENSLGTRFSKLPTNCLSVFDHFVGLALKGLNTFVNIIYTMTLKS